VLYQTNDFIQGRTMQTMFQDFEDLKDLPDRNQDVTLKLDELMASFFAYKSSEMIVNDLEDNLGGIVRAELRGMLVPTLKTCRP
jgi:hypothetical protein